MASVGQALRPLRSGHSHSVDHATSIRPIQPKGISLSQLASNADADDSIRLGTHGFAKCRTDVIDPFVDNLLLPRLSRVSREQSSAPLV
jgi:hypothetical protein